MSHSNERLGSFSLGFDVEVTKRPDLPSDFLGIHEATGKLIRHSYWRHQYTMPELIQGRELFYELQNVYRINVPDIDYEEVIDTNGKRSIRTYIDWVEGHNLSDIASGVDDLKPARLAFDSYGDSLCQYVIDKATYGGRFLFDTTTRSNLVYGKRRNDKEDQLYFVDVEPVSTSFIDLSGSFNIREFAGNIDALFVILSSFEANLGEQPASWQSFFRIISEYPPLQARYQREKERSSRVLSEGVAEKIY